MYIYNDESLTNSEAMQIYDGGQKKKSNNRIVRTLKSHENQIDLQSQILYWSRLVAVYEEEYFSNCLQTHISGHMAVQDHQKTGAEVKYTKP